jgi:hypothetical protein
MMVTYPMMHHAVLQLHLMCVQRCFLLVQLMMMAAVQRQ